MPLQLVITEDPSKEVNIFDIDPLDRARAVRLADEGIPVRAIARGLKVPSDTLYDALREALEEGRICELPRDDWPPGSARSQRAIYAGTILENEDQLQMICARVFKTTKQQSAVVAVLIKRREITKAQVHIILQENRPASNHAPTDEKMVDVVMFHIRKKLKVHEVPIDTIWGTGYAMPAVHRDRAIKLLEENATAYAAYPGVETKEAA